MASLLVNLPWPSGSSDEWRCLLLFFLYSALVFGFLLSLSQSLTNLFFYSNFVKEHQSFVSFYLSWMFSWWYRRWCDCKIVTIENSATYLQLLQLLSYKPASKSIYQKQNYCEHYPFDVLTIDVFFLVNFLKDYTEFLIVCFSKILITNVDSFLAVWFEKRMLFFVVIFRNKIKSESYLRVGKISACRFRKG